MKNIKTVAITSLLFLAAAVPAFAATTTGSFNQGTVTWTVNPNAKCYRIYYKETGAKMWQHAVRCRDLGSSAHSYTIGYLKQSTSYTYDVVSVGYDGKETWTGDHVLMTTPMQ